MFAARTFVIAASAVTAVGTLGLAGASAATAATSQYSATQVAGSCHQRYDANAFSVTLKVHDGTPNATYTVRTQGVSGTLHTNAAGNGSETLSNVPSVRSVQSASFTRGSTTSVDYANACNSGSGK